MIIANFLLLKSINFVVDKIRVSGPIYIALSSHQDPLASVSDSFLIHIIFSPYIVFFTYSVMFAAVVLIFFFKQHSNLLLLLLYIELSLFLVGFLFAMLFFVSFSYFTGLVYALTILALSAAEAIIGLSLLLTYFRVNKGSISMKGFSLWKNDGLLHNKKPLATNKQKL